jgi:Tol biopolymer transport system component
MNLAFIHLGLLGFLRLASASFVAAWVSSPMSWSPDGQWLSYTVVTGADLDELTPGWIFRTANGNAGVQADRPAEQSKRVAAAPSALCRIWATQPDRQVSVLIEESHWPLSAPAWSPRGRSIAFGRFVPESIEPAQPIQKGRYEVVVQDALDRKRVVWSAPDFELDPTTRDSFPQLICSWSTDGLYLAIPHPGRQPAIEIVRTDTKKRIKRIENACLPSWSPDGSRCAFLRPEGPGHQLECVERIGPTFSDPQVLATGAIASSPHWSGDSRSIFAVIERTTAPWLDLEIVRFSLEPNGNTRLMSLAPDPARRRATIRGVAIDFDRDGERCFFSVDLQGRDCDVAWSIPRDRMTHKRFHPLDNSQRIKSVAVSPDGQLVAIRFGSESGLTAPAVYDSETEQTSLLVPDDDARKHWLSFLASTARHLLKTALPPAVVDGQEARRPTLLPLPGELPPMDTTVGRLARLARFGSGLCSVPTDPPEANGRQSIGPFDAEARLFFHYLRGDFQAAATDFDNLEPFVADPRERLGLLSIRAQLLWSRGEKAEARGVIDYLVACEGPNRQLIEDTPSGPVLTPYITADQAWARYMSTHTVDRHPSKTVPNGELPADVLDPRIQLQDNPPIPEMPLIDRGAAPAPFSPQRPGREVR